MRKLVLVATVAFAFAAAPAFAQTAPSRTSPPTSGSSAATAGHASRAEVVTAAEFVRMAAISDMFEIQSSQLALQHTQNAQVRQFAQEMVQDHQKTTNELRQMVNQMHSSSSSATPSGRTASSTAPGSAGHSSSAAAAGSRNAPGSSSSTTTSGASAPAGSASGSSATGGGSGGAMATAQTGMQMPTQLDAQHEQKLQQLRQAGQGAAFDRMYVQQQIEAHQMAVDMFQNYARSGDNAQLRQFAQRTLPDLQDHLRKAQQLQNAVGHG